MKRYLSTLNDLIELCGSHGYVTVVADLKKHFPREFAILQETMNKRVKEIPALLR
jgi:hypothetical protein